MGLRVRLRGCVQGIGFRPWVHRVARELGVRGSVANAPDGVWIDAFGTREMLEVFRLRVERPALPGARVDAVEVSAIAIDREPADFSILPSRRHGELRFGDPALAPDLPICPACEHELADAGSRRHRHPFVACAQCGPRYTLARALPWDRERSSMADFPLCPACAREYADPGDRRFHAEASSCPDCGPTLVATEPGGPPTFGNEAAIARAVGALRVGRIVAVQGIGGFHLACDASNEAAVRRLRKRKRRPTRPLAVMVRSVLEAEKHALVDADERALLSSEARPIVLLRRRPDSGLAPSLAPGSPVLGILLAYSPLHVLLLEDFGGALVMTSANRSGEPIVYRVTEAESKLGDVADLVLAGDREIVAASDDSVAALAASGPVLLRRSRGHVPRPIRLAEPAGEPVLAFGGHWSNTVCVISRDRAWPSAHVGDIESPDSVERLEATIERWLHWLEVTPTLVAHDLHEGYESTRLARDFAAKLGARLAPVQHHHAHLAAVLGEHGARGPALALVWDGTGAGPDGAAWGGELLFGDARGFDRMATFRPIALAGGDRAIQEPWRIAQALLQDAFQGDAPVEALALFDRVDRDEVAAVAALLERPELCAAAHGVGRYFDAIGALLLARPRATYNGELAQALNFAAGGRAAEPYPFTIDSRTRPWQLDLRPMVRAITLDLLDGRPPSQLSDRFHATLVSAGQALVAQAAARLAERGAPVVLAGGCFQNTLLLDGLEQRLGGELEVLRPRQLPPGDGGLAFGQALVAGARARRED